jgi:hypothetical protein
LPRRAPRRRLILVAEDDDINQKIILRQLALLGYAAEIAANDEVFYLPSYSPELSPEEMLNADLKHEISTKVPVRTKEKLRAAASQDMRKLEQNPERVCSYFRDPRVAYAA